MSAAPKPLCRKKFLANTIIDMDSLLHELAAHHPFPNETLNSWVPRAATTSFGSVHAKRGVKSLEQEDHLFFAKELWAMANQFRGLALDRRTDWGRYLSLQGDIWSPGGKPHIGSMVYIQDAARYNFYGNAVGQLLRVEQEPRKYGGRRLYEEDGGPVRMSEQYVIRLLDGTEFSWYNASIGYVPTTRTIQMYRKIVADVYGEDRMWA